MCFLTRSIFSFLCFIRSEGIVFWNIQHKKVIVNKKIQDILTFFEIYLGGGQGCDIKNRLWQWPEPQATSEGVLTYLPCQGLVAAKVLILFG